MTDTITPTKYVSLTGDQKVDGVISGYAWDGTITYAFPTSSTSYSYGGEKDYDFSSISSQQRSAALFLMEQSYGNTANDGFSVEGFTNANFVAGSADTATVRFAESSLPDTAWAYEPGTGSWSGDIWFGTAYAWTANDYRYPEFGNYAGHTLAHELGHALGLKHGHEADTNNSAIVPDAYDSLEYTIMTYRTYVGDSATGYKYEQNGAPQSFMMLDIAALQEMYGADYTTNSGNTVYKWKPNEGVTYVNGVAAITPAANRIFATIWDGGGVDTYDLSAYTTALQIDLRPGSYSVFSGLQLADLGGGPNNGYARGNIFNALLYHDNLASLIENVQAGSGNDTIIGNEADNILWGNAGNDSLTGAAGNDTLNGGAGLDRMSGGLGDDIYIVDVATDVVIENADEGTDTVKTAFWGYTLANNVENLTFTGTGAFSGTGNAAANVITGGAGSDWLDGKAGSDTLIGGAGDDTYIVDALGDALVEASGGGTDVVRTALASYSLAAIANVENLAFTGIGSFTGAGNSLDNTITGGAGNDTLSGDAGNDRLNGGAGVDMLSGGTGNDVYVVDNAGDTVTEGTDEGIDTVQTNLASYTLGADVENLTYTGTAAFTGNGNALNNIMTGGMGIDTLRGGAGDDTYVISTGDIVIEDADGGIDTVQTGLAAYTLSANVENLTYAGTMAFAGTGNALDNVIKGGIAADRLTGAAGNDTLDGGAGADTLIGGTGDDVYIIDIATDVVTEAVNEGTDTVRTRLAGLVLAANVENLTFTGTGNFAGTGNALANTITGGVGNDTLNGGAGADTLIGGMGNDTYIVDNVSDVIVENVGEGTDTVQAWASYTLAANVENLIYIGAAAFAGTGNDLNNTITGGAAIDTLSGGDGNDTLNGGAGADTLIGGTGNDTYIVDSAADIITENADEGIDTVQTALASYTLAGLVDIENLTYTGTAAFAGTGNDLNNTIRGAAGADTLDGKAGADTLIGGAGNDTYLVDDLADVVTEAVNQGTDLIKTALSAYALTSIANVENLTFTGSGDFAGTGNGLVNIITGGAGNDTLDGGAGVDTLVGGAGNDVYIIDNASDVIAEAAGAGTDEIRTSLATYSIAALVNVENLTYTGTGNFTGTGNALANTITGGVGNDTLNGGAGADTLIGGMGNDTYIVDSAADIITENADEGTDTVQTALASYSLAGLVDVENLTYTGTAAFAGTGNDLNNTIRGAAGADTLNGGAGDDTLIGGAGNDTYLVDDLADVVTEAVNQGTDLIKTALSAYALTSIANVENLTFTGSGDFAGTGNGLVNIITGGAGNDTLDGGAGVDTLVGGAGNDVYIIDNASDVIAEAAGAGTDEIRTSLTTYSIAALVNVEKLTYTGTGNFTGTGNALANTITGGVGNDTLNGGAGADTLIGGMGNDTYIVDNVSDVIVENVGEGTDTVQAWASYTLAANVENLIYIGAAAFAGTGNDLNNTITGGAAIDTLSGGDGNDTLNGGAGADTLIGGTGNDTYIVDSAADIITENADEGIDTVQTALASYTLAGLVDIENLTYTGTAAFAGTGNDLNNTIRGAAGADTLDGKAGADTLIGGAGNDTYLVDDLADVVTEAVNQGTDLIKTALSAYALTSIANVENLTFTGSGDFAGTGNGLVNIITGGAGNDTLDGGAGVDTLVGGAGNDVYIIDNASDVIAEAAGAGTDEIRTSLATYSIAALVNVENLTYTGTGNFTGTGNALANTITGGVGNDTLNGGAGADTLIGGMGNDTYIVDSAADIITENADEGTDTVQTALASYSLAGLVDVENLTYTGTAAFAGTGNDLNNTIRGAAGADTLNGGAGDDTLIGGAGSDRMSGGAGDDTYVVDVAADITIENADEGTDTVRTVLASYTLAANVENLTYTGMMAFIGTGNAAANVITGSIGADTLDGKAGADTLIGGAGNDTYIVDALGDALIEASGGGTDGIKTDLASYSLAAIDNVENLTFTGSGGFTGAGNSLDNTITGGAGNDTLSGDAGNDRLNGGAGVDMLSGGTGNDVYVVDNAGDTVTEGTDEGIDTVQTNLASYTLGADVENLTYTGTAAFTGNGNALNNIMTGGMGIDTLRGGAGDDTYVISTGDIVIEDADGGIDTVQTGLAAYTLSANVENLTYAGTMAFAGTGNALDNVIKGGIAADRLTGAAGNDTLDGGAGADTLIGGTGDDVYIIDIATDVVTEAVNEGTDTVRTRLAGLVLAANVENLTFTGTGNFAGTGNALANTITGGVGNDTLNGGAGADTLIGGMGNDTYIVDNVSDVIVENVGEGTDTVQAWASYTLAANVENLTYTGTAAFAGTGNDLNNTIRGAAGADTLDGKAGADTLIGGAGNDTYLVDDLADVVTEAVNQGTDLIKTALSAYALTSIANVENLTFTGSGDFAGTGNGLVNIITGGAGNDTLDGGAGADTLIGGAGNDVYIIDNASDVIVENVGEGTDTVQAWASYTLAANVENLVYTGTAGFNGTGNDLANTITGGVGNDTLNGGAGADTLIGGTGNDTYIVDSAADIITENADEGIDTVQTALASYTLAGLVDVENLTYTGTAAFAGTGNDLNNTIRGAAGADTLDGKAGADTLIGGAGNDTYLVDDLADVVTEAVNQGTDLIKTALSAYALTSIANVENLTFTGSGDFAGTGNGLVNIITGGAGNDTLDGGAGVDTLVGGAGNDVYIIDNASDVIAEAAGAGTDEIRTSLATYSIAALVNVENLTYTGTGNFTGTGNALANTITGGVGNDTLNGGAGADTLIGGMGNDTYIVDSADDVVTENAGEGIDTVRTALASYSLAGLVDVENLTYTGTGAFTGTGNSLANTITGGGGADTLSGGAGNDTLSGGAGADTLIGGAGNDTYFIDNAGDVIAESADEGIDTVRTTLAYYTTASNVENLTYTGTGNFTGLGNELSNTITGGAGNDTLNGGTGADTLIGGAGNDYYVVDNVGVAVIEKANGGVDLVQTSLANYTLGENIEDLRSAGDPTVAFVGTGNALDNWIEGNFGGSNTLTGGAGDDRLWGGAGADFFVYSPNWGHDIIENFVATGAWHDTIRIDHTIFADWASLLAASHPTDSSTIITADANNTIMLWNVSLSSLQSADFQFV
ncbi:M10 family metallopeptidase C-terminal domain-containing protein [Rhizobium sp. YTU87027]|uniref:M10 family metallopeptidase C-terminal domain-containing protein n=1 Tax=Rhizobium sp. YTU87027 TaxID=3417741 RepID=UPI003D687C40